MSTPAERFDYDKKVAYIIDKICGDNQEAQKYLFALGKIARIADDLFDEDVSVSRKDCLDVIELLLVEIPHNSFYLSHREKFDGLHAVIWNAWLDSNILEKGDETDKIYYHVLRDFIYEFLPYSAFVLQGYSKMREISIETRILFKKKFGE